MAEKPRLGRNAVWAFVGFAWPTILMLVAIPVYLGNLGVRGFGLWSIGLSLLGAGSALNLGLGEATIRYVAAHWAQGERTDATRVVWAFLLIYMSIGGLACFGLWSASSRIASGWFDLAGDELQAGTTLFRIIALGLPAVISVQAVLGVFDGMQRFNVSQSLVIARSTLQVVGGIVAVSAGAGTTGLAAVYVASLWGVWLIGLGLGLAGLPGVRPADLRVVATVRTLFSFGIFSSLTSFGHMAVQQLDKVIIGAVVGVDAVSYYSVPQGIAFKIGALCHSVSRVLLPFFSSRSAPGSGARLAEPVFVSWRLLVLLSLAVSSGIAATSPWLLRLWAGDDLARESLAVYWVLIAVYALNAMIYVIPHNYLSAVGRPDRLARNTLAAGVVTLAMQGILAYFFGVQGAAVGALFYPLGQLPLVHTVVSKMEGASVIDKLLRGIWVPSVGALMSIALGVASGFAAESWSGTALAGLATSMGVCGLVLLGYGWAITLRRHDRFGSVLSMLISRISGQRSNR